MDSAFKTAAYPGLTTEQLKDAARKANDAYLHSGAGSQAEKEAADKLVKMNAELERRERVASGDVSAMTAGERLRHYKDEAGL